MNANFERVFFGSDSGERTSELEVKCLAVWTSFGVMHSVLTFIGDQLEKIQFQEANKFFYEIAIGRVETRLKFPPNHELYFTNADRQSDRHTLFVYRTSRRLVQRKVFARSDFYDCKMIQVRADFFTFQGDSSPSNEATNRKFLKY